MEASSYSCSPEVMVKIELLFTILRSENFQVTTDNYIDLLHIAVKSNAQSLNELAYKICPIIATNEEEQLKFHEIIKKLDNLSGDDLIYEKNKAVPVTIPAYVKEYPAIFVRTAVEMLIVLIAGLIFYLLWKPVIVVFGTGQIQPLSVIKKGETFKGDATQLDYFVNHPSDTSNVVFSWNFGDNKVQQGFKSEHVYAAPGNYIITRTARSDRYAISKTSDSINIHVCEHRPKLELRLPTTVALKGKPVSISAISDSTAVAYQWTIDDSITQKSTSSTITHTFQSQGYHRIDCTAYPDTRDSLCTAFATANIEVQDAGRKYSVTVSGYNRLPARLWQLRGSVLAIIGLLVSAGIFAVWFIKKTHKRNIFTENYLAKKNVYEIPFQINELSIIHPDKKLFRMLNLMRRRADEEVRELDIYKTLKRTISKMGLSQLVFSPRRKFQEYLILIDNTNPSGSFRHLFSYLSRMMMKADIRLNVYYFDRRFMFHNIQVPAGIPLDQVISMHPDSIPVIMGDGKNLLHSMIPVVQKKYLAQFNDYRLCTIITPIPRDQWGIEEKTLAKHFLIGAADEPDMLQLIDKLHLSPELQTPGEHSNDLIQYDIDFNNIKELADYFDGSEYMLQWLCSLAVYPKLRWEIVLAFGKTLAGKYPLPNGISYKSLLKMCRIPWLSQGSIPPSVRLELLKHLHLENEISVRYSLIGMLQQARLYRGKGYYYDTELEDQMAINKFILYVHDPILYGRYKNEVAHLKYLWQHGLLLDSPLRLYLEGGGNRKWQTPIKSGRKVISLKKYFNVDKPFLQLQNLNYKKLVATFIIAATALSGVRYLMLRDIPPVALLTPLYTEKPPDSLIQVRYLLVKNMLACDASDTSFVDDLSGYFNVSGRQYPIAYRNNSSTITADLPYTAVVGKSGKVTLTMDSGNPSYVENALAFDTVFTEGSIDFKCERAAPINSTDLGEQRRAAGTSPSNGILVPVNPGAVNNVPAGKANFMASNRIGCTPLTTSFLDFSTGGGGIVSRRWDLGNGSPIVNNSKNVRGTYTEPGIYKIMLAVRFANGTADTMMQQIIIVAAPIADFTANVTTADSPATIHFTDKSTTRSGKITAWSWDLGVSASTLQNPDQLYTKSGNYSITLIVSNNQGCRASITKRNYIKIREKPTVPF